MGTDSVKMAGREPRKWLAHALFLPLGAASVALWYLNLVHAVDWLSKGRWGIPGSGLLASLDRNPVLKPFHYLATVDFSTVTTLLFVLLALSAYLNYLRLFQGKLRTVNRYPTSRFYQIVRPEGPGAERKLLPAFFPLFHGYKVTFLQLGLMGTLLAMTVAFQETSRLSVQRDQAASQQGAAPRATDVQEAGHPVIGFEPTRLDEATRKVFEDGRSLQKKMDDLGGSNLARIDAKSNDAQTLLAALGTALWSSLMAIFIAFILGPYVLEPAGRAHAGRFHARRLAPLSLPDPADVGKGLGELEQHALGTGQSLAHLGQVLGIKAAEAAGEGTSLIHGFQMLNKELEKMGQSMQGMNQLEAISAIKGKLDRIVDSEIPSLKAELLGRSEKQEREIHQVQQKVMDIQQELGIQKALFAELKEMIRKSLDRNDDRIVRRAVARLHDHFEKLGTSA